MSGSEAIAASGAATAALDEDEDLLGQILDTATADVEKDRKEDATRRAQELVHAYVERARAKQVVFDRNLPTTIAAMVAEIDREISDQLNRVMHHPEFLRLEGSWRGLAHLTSNTNTNNTLKIKMLPAKKHELTVNFGRDLEQTRLYTALHQETYNVAGGEPFGALIGDYEWGPGQEDVETLASIARVCRLSFTPFLTAASPEMVELRSWSKLDPQAGFSTLTESTQFAKWRSFRESEDASFVALTLPRVLARMPYGSTGKSLEQFTYEELPRVPDPARPGKFRLGQLAHDNYCWMNAAYALGVRLTYAFANYGFCTRIRGLDSGGKVGNLPLHNFMSEYGDLVNKCPTEVNIPDNVDAELGKLGFLPLVHYKDTDYAVFFGAQTARKPDKYDTADANANAEISARLPYVMATSRFAHNLKVMGRNMIGSFKETEDVQFELDRWIKQYSQKNENAKEELKAKYPLREARVEVQEVAGRPGVYNAVAYLRPWLQMEELNASLRMVARIPGSK